VGIVRVSGPCARTIGEKISGRELSPRRAIRARFRDADHNTVDDGIAIYFAAPASFTGEEVVELQGHGGPIVMHMLLNCVLAEGARIARPGEFTERAYLNGRMDLAQAEAVADLISSASVAAAQGALRSLRGEFSARVHEVDAQVVTLRTFVEAAIDFPDEEVDFFNEGGVGERIRTISHDLTELMEASRQGVLLRDGVTVALLGAPNVGKSSLLNILSGEERAIVTEIPGTTRDLVRADLDLDGLPVEIVDTAGIRESTDPVELEGVRRAEDQAVQADLVIVVTDLTDPNECLVAAEIQARATSLIRVFNKVDQSDLTPGLIANGQPDEPQGVRVSALTGAGIQELRSAIKEAVGFADQPGAFTARQRHLAALQDALSALHRASDLLRDSAAGELIAEELRSAHHALGSIVGEMTPDELLGEIFASFCLGK
jgi:tRNA modification GTPase